MAQHEHKDGTQLSIQRSRAEVRKMLNRMLTTDSEFDAFLLDYFPEVKKACSSGMDRVAKINLLIEKAEIALIVSQLQDIHPEFFHDTEESRYNQINAELLKLEIPFTFEQEDKKYCFSDIRSAEQYISIANRIGDTTKGGKARPKQTIVASVDFSGHPDVRLVLEADGMFNLYNKLIQLEGYHVSSRFEIKKLYNVGAESVIYLAHDKVNNEPVICKIPFLDYSQPTKYGNSDIEIAREHLLEENHMLLSYKNRFFPRHLALEIAPSPLHPKSRSARIKEKEVFLFEEFVAGPTLEEETWALHRDSGRQPKHLGKLLLRITRDILDFFDALYDEGAGYFYTDLCPRNMIIDERTKIIRHVDAGSVIATLGKRSRRSYVSYTEPFLLPQDLIKFRSSNAENAASQFEQRTCLGMLGRTLYNVATNKIPMPGEDPDYNHSLFKELSSPIKEFIVRLASGQIADFHEGMRLFRLACLPL